MARIKISARSIIILNPYNFPFGHQIYYMGAKYGYFSFTSETYFRWRRSSFVASRNRGRRVVVVFVLEFAGRGISTSKLIVSSFLCCYSSGSVWETAAELLMTKTSKMFSLFVARTDDNELNKIKWLSKNFTCSKAARTNILFCYCLRAWGDIFLLVAILLSPKAHCRNELFCCFVNDELW